MNNKKELWYNPKTEEYSWTKPEMDVIDPPEMTPCRVDECREGMHGGTYLVDNNGHTLKIDVWSSTVLAERFVNGKEAYYWLETESVFKTHGLNTNKIISKIGLHLQPCDFKKYVEDIENKYGISE